MANHLPAKEIIGAVAQLSCDFLSAAVASDPELLMRAECHAHASQMAYDLAQHHIERTFAVREALMQREPQVEHVQQ